MNNNNGYYRLTLASIAPVSNSPNTKCTVSFGCPKKIIIIS